MKPSHNCFQEELYLRIMPMSRRQYKSVVSRHAQPRAKKAYAEGLAIHSSASQLLTQVMYFVVKRERFPRGSRYNLTASAIKHTANSISGSVVCWVTLGPVTSWRCRNRAFLNIGAISQWRGLSLQSFC